MQSPSLSALVKFGSEEKIYPHGNRSEGLFSLVSCLTVRKIVGVSQTAKVPNIFLYSH